MTRLRRWLTLRLLWRLHPADCTCDVCDPVGAHEAVW